MHQLLKKYFRWGEKNHRIIKPEEEQIMQLQQDTGELLKLPYST